MKRYSSPDRPGWITQPDLALDIPVSIAGEAPSAVRPRVDPLSRIALDHTIPLPIGEGDYTQAQLSHIQGCSVRTVRREEQSAVAKLISLFRRHPDLGAYVTSTPGALESGLATLDLLHRHGLRLGARKGFTLIEFLAALALVATLCAIGLFALTLKH